VIRATFLRIHIVKVKRAEPDAAPEFSSCIIDVDVAPHQPYKQERRAIVRLCFHFSLKPTKIALHTESNFNHSTMKAGSEMSQKEEGFIYAEDVAS
jgi:hypothetical protein